jgi:hypothetical protein
MLVRRRRHQGPLTSDERWELLIGPPVSRARPHGFRSEADRRRAWEEHREELIAEARQMRPGNRPWAWWHYEAGREEHLAPYPLHFEGTMEEKREAVGAYEIEPVLFVALRGELSDQELEEIEAKAREVEPRIGTDAEHWGSGGVNYPDRRAVKLAIAVKRAVDDV